MSIRKTRGRKDVNSLAVDMSHLYWWCDLLESPAGLGLWLFFYTTRYIPRWQQIYFLHTAERHFHKIMFPHMTQPSWRSGLGFLFKYGVLLRCLNVYIHITVIDTQVHSHLYLVHVFLWSRKKINKKWGAREWLKTFDTVEMINLHLSSSLYCKSLYSIHINALLWHMSVTSCLTCDNQLSFTCNISITMY